MATIANQAATRTTPSVGLKERRSGETGRRILVYGLLIFLSGMFLFPLFWMITTALKPDSQIFLWPPQWVPSPIQWSNFQEAFGNPLLPFNKFVVNTLIIEAGVVSGRLISCTLVAYGFARLKAPGKNVLFTILLATLML